MSRRDEEETLFPSEAQGVVLGLVSGAVLGAAATLLFSTKTGEMIKDNLCDACEGLAEKSKHFTDSLSSKFHNNGRRSHENLNMAIGGIAGSILGISAILFLSSNASKGLRKQIRHSIEVLSDKGQKMAHHFSDKAHENYENAEDQIASWVETAQEFLGKHNGKHHGEHESIPEKALHWTLLGIRLYQSLKKER